MNRSCNLGLAFLIAASTVGVAQATGPANPDCPTTPKDHATMDHGAHSAIMAKCTPSPLPTTAGQAAYGMISEVVRILKADPNTDWSKVNVEALRQHLIDMDLVTMQSVASQRTIPGGVEIDVTGTGRTVSAIRRMVTNHSRMLDAGSEYRATAHDIPNGVRLSVTARDAKDVAAAVRIRGLGFAGIMTEGDHHAAHHVALARGEAVHQP